MRKKLKIVLYFIDIKIILDLVPNHSSHLCEWFVKSLNKSSEYADWYVWEDGTTDEDGNRLPPNNWASLIFTSLANLIKN